MHNAHAVLLKTLSDIELSVIAADRSYQVWWAISHDGLKDYRNAINNYNYVDFFNFILPVLKQNIFINLSRVFDRHGDFSGVRKLRESLEYIGHKDCADQINFKLYPHSDTIKSIKGIRDQLIGHRVNTKNSNEVFKQNLIFLNQLKDLIEDLKVIVHEVSTLIDYSPRQDLESLRLHRAAISLLEALTNN